MKKFILWVLAFVITVSAAIYQRHTGPTYPKKLAATVNDSVYQLKLVRSLALDERPEVKLAISDTSVKARLYYKRLGTNDEFTGVDFNYKVYPIHSFVMNRIFKMNEEKGLFAVVPVQAAAGKLEYYLEITDNKGSTTYLKEEPVVIRFKGGVPAFILAPHILLMFIAMLFSTLAGLMAVTKVPEFRKYSYITLVLFIIGGIILGPIVQKYAFGELWTGIPFGWDLTDNKTLIALIFWILAVYQNRKSEKPVYVILAAIMLLAVFSIPHSMFGSNLDYSTGKVTQGIIPLFF